jgi:hypothetical protein
MSRRWMAAVGGALSITLIAGGFALAQDDGVAYTGCLDAEGNLSNVAVGAEPVAPCERSQQLAQWSQTGPAGSTGESGEQGPAGETGAQGEQGEKGDRGKKGDPGTAASYFVDQAFSAAVLATGQAKCDEGDLVTGGGFRKMSGPPSTVNEDYPTGKRTWTVTLMATDGSLLPIDFEVYAVCSDLDPLR